MQQGQWDTPVVTVDLDIMERNIRQMQSYCDAHGIKLRPHIKTHKIPAIAHMQLEAGARGITCQKLGEAEVMAAAGIDDILISYPIIGEPKLERLSRLARQVSMSLVADSVFGVDGMARAARAAGRPLRVLVECNTGLGRTGVQTADGALELARYIAGSSGLEFGGLMTHPCLPEAGPFLRTAAAAIAADGIPVPEVSVGGSDAFRTAHTMGVVTEIRAGTYVFFDLASVRGGFADFAEVALRVHATVVSRPAPDRAILDAGSKTLSSDRFPQTGTGYGLIVEYPEAQIAWLTEEHGMVDLTACRRRPEVGEVVTLLPNHVCVVVNLHDELHGLRRGRVETVWPVAARGRVR